MASNVKFNYALPAKGQPSAVKRTYGVNLRDLCRAKTEDAVQVLYDIMMDGAMPANARVKAAENILDRGFGKPTQYVAPVVPAAQELGGMSDEELAQFIADNMGAAQEIDAEYEEVVENTDLDPDQPELDQLNAAKAKRQVN